MSDDLATILKAHADPVLDEHFPRLGPCGLCGVKGLDQRHRVVDAIAGHLEAGESLEDVASELDVPQRAVWAVGEWMKRWPEAWTGEPGGGKPASPRVRAAIFVNRILYDLGALSAVVPRGPLRDQVDDETEHMAALAEAISAGMQYGHEEATDD